MVFGTVIGFLLLDEKDDNTLIALQVTPLTTRGYLGYRMGLPMAISVVMTVVALQISGVVEIGLFPQVVVSVAAAPMAPAFALLLAGFARNKVQGFAISKAAGVLTWPALIGWFIEPPWQWAFGLCPTFWPAKLFWDLDAGLPGAWISAGVAVLYTSAIGVWLFRRFDRRLHR